MHILLVSSALGNLSSTSQHLAIDGEDEKEQYFLKENLVLQGEVLDLSAFKLFQGLKGVTLHETDKLEHLSGADAKPDLIVFDAAMGMENISQHVQQKHMAKWVVLDVADIQQALHYLQLGASGILTQPSEAAISKCLQTIAEEQIYLDADFVQILALRQIKKMLLPFKHLTAREYDVFCLLAEGYSIQTIATLLSISPKTAFNCQAQLRKKLAVRTQQDIFAFAKKHGLVK
ncbi:response regulator transcription factor [methane-oxidizing endosymbiont of Gigantopelta aegis]|uniref:response regulator transcription factor n=1 Tax=methane-oxidizing endosymbiont of Gigantopelta aegis TaxID=2794938 RepID=UPI0018DB836C|nr:response regulator transcription factor [methane-oxidizing endosymbiont of Gigantopelta aegis]